jgi:hypothetical protein
MRAKVTVREVGDQTTSFYLEIREKALVAQAASHIMATGAFDYSRAESGRVDFYPASRILKIEFSEINS